MIVSANGSQDAVELFNGKDLMGWSMVVPALDGKPEAEKPFFVKDGNLVTLGRPAGYLQTDESYSNYMLSLEWRFSGQGGNCGVLVHVSEPRVFADMWPQSIEVQLQHQQAGDFWVIHEDIKVPDMVARRGPEENWGTFQGKARRIANLTDGSEKPLGEWNEMIVLCQEDRVTVWVNGDLVNSGYGATATSGRIALQSEGVPVEFRKLVVDPL